MEMVENQGFRKAVTQGAEGSQLIYEDGKQQMSSAQGIFKIA